MKDATEIAVVIDRSGSMGGREDDTIGGVNAFLKKQKELPGEARMTIILFDNRYEVLVASRLIQDVPDLTPETYFVRDSTALYDAVGKTITELGARLAAMPEGDRPSKVLVAILTDGAENASKEFTRDNVFDMIKRQRDTFSWEFLFLAAGQAAFRAGAGLGIDMATKGVLFSNSAGNVRSAYASVSSKVSELRRSKGAAEYLCSTASMADDFVQAGGTAENAGVQGAQGPIDPVTGLPVPPIGP